MIFFQSVGYKCHCGLLLGWNLKETTLALKQWIIYNDNRLIVVYIEIMISSKYKGNYIF